MREELVAPAPITGLDNEFLADVLQGLRKPQKSIPCKYFYDERGSRLFDRICELDEYYPTRTESGIMHAHGAEMAAAIGPRALIVEYGSGSSLKTRILLDRLIEPAGYVPIDISGEHLLQSAAAIARRHPEIEIVPLCADFTRDFEVPPTRRPPARRVVYFPGSTIGNFLREETPAFMQRIARVAGPGGGLLIGVDLKKPRAVLETAYNDEAGVTAAFNLNLLERINRELGADFKPDAFRHEARWNEPFGRIEMHLVSRRVQSVHLAGEAIEFAAGETILTEYSCKYTLEEFTRLAATAGFRPRGTWMDARRWFGVLYFTA